MNGYYAQLIQILKQHGYTYSRPGKGSHEIWRKGKDVAIVPFNCKSRHTANQIMKDAGIKHRF